MVGWIRAGWGFERVGGTVENTLKRGWNKKEGRGNKDLKRGQAGSRGVRLKNECDGTPLRIVK